MRRGQSGCAQTGPGRWVVRSPCQDPLGIGCTCPVVDYSDVGEDAAWLAPHPDYQALQALGIERGACPACLGRAGTRRASTDSEKGLIQAVESTDLGTALVALDSGAVVELGADRLAALRQHLGDDLSEITFVFELETGSRHVVEVRIDSLPEGFQPPFRPDAFTRMVADERVRPVLRQIGERWKQSGGAERIGSGWDMHMARAMRCIAGIADATPQAPYHPDLDDADQLRIFLTQHGVPVPPLVRGLNVLRLPDP